MKRRLLICSLFALSTLSLPASAGQYDLIVADSIDLTLCNGCVITLAGLDYGLIVNTGTTDITLADLRAAKVTATSSNPDVELYPFINIPNDQIVGSIHPGEAMGSIVQGNELLVPFLRPGETLRNLSDMQFMAYSVRRNGSYVGPVDFHVRMKLAGQLTEFTIHADFKFGPHDIRFLGASRVIGGVPVGEDPECSVAAASPALVWPPNGRLVPIEITGITDPEGDPVTISVTDVTQDEPVGSTHGAGGRQIAPIDAPVDSSDGHHGGTRCPDAQVIDGKAYVRAERDAAGNGRVYVIRFSATDNHGGECAGSVAVCVPQDRGHGSACVDDGQFHDSMDCSPQDTLQTPLKGLVSTMVQKDGRQIRYSLLKDSEVDVEMYDVAGRRIATLDQGRRTAGEHTVKWENQVGARGVYFIRMRVDGEAQPGVIRVRN